MTLLSEKRKEIEVDGRRLRLQRIVDDIETTTKASAADENNSYQNLKYSEEVFTFEYCRSETSRVFYTIAVCVADYPQQSVLTWKTCDADATDNIEFFSDRLPVVFNRLAARHNKNDCIKFDVSQSLDGSVIPAISRLSVNDRQHHQDKADLENTM